MNYKNQKNTEQDNDWAKNLEGNPIHISQAESGAKGYYCMGCGKEMQAVKRKIAHYQSYFRHHVKDLDTSKVECVNSSRVYREKLAYNYFMRVKMITVPAVYKYPPKGVEGFPYLIEEKQTIYAHRVDREVTFFEDENGVIHSGKNTKVDERYLSIRPDAVFYDVDDKPILFIEFIVTHKPDVVKLNKLQRLGINTVQIIVPKLNEVELEKEISKASKVKWTYNENESNAEYIPVFEGNTEGIPPIDEEQRKLFEESYFCRAAQVANLIRSIKRCLESEHYRRIEFQFKQEISRIENATKGERTRLADIQTGIEREIDSELRGSRTGFEERNRKFQTEKTDLEERYTRKRSEINGKIFSINRDIDFREGIGGTEDGIRRDFEGRKRELELERIHIETEEGRFAKQEREIDVSIGEESSIPGDFEQRRSEVEQSFEGKRQDLESKISGFREIQNEEEGRIRAEFEGINKQIAERISQRDILQQDELSPRIKTILELWRVFDNYENGRETLLRYRSGIEIIKSGTWKEWD
ncbi:hypothetical protein G6N05_02450 [Flavobacterium sp. F372]|uniref:C2H2-type domain-containing protein n=1 Tax=Flavobacterium bernardetii TaxID=2813823 RepID=A0ABR7IVI3_9FLAO|nr:hypothetical protein [Flavobacterium bernardetii]MBC5833738.1 hypothetical protein [Flavobacterium bernardetii]NHF68971.1 hypothetical protein [Flavobacterium bernardetii]